MKKLLILALLLVVACKKKKAEDTPAPGTGTAAVAADAAAAVDAAEAAPDAAGSAAAPEIDAAAAAVDPATLCPQVIDKVIACKDDAAFKTALADGADAAKKKEIDMLLKGIKDWPKNICTYPIEYEFPGFLDKWDQFAAPGTLDDCAKLGAAVKGAGGLFGGETAK